MDIKATNRQQNQADDRGKSSLYIHTTTGVNIVFNCTRKQLGENGNLKEIFLSVRRKLYLKQRLLTSGVTNKPFFFWFGLKVLFSG